MKQVFVLAVVAALAMASVPGVLAQENYAAGKSYTADPPLRTDWLGDSGGELTNGVTDWGWDPVTGWDGSVAANPRAIVIDLGEAKSDITSVVVTVFISISSACSPMAAVTVSGSATSGTTGFTEWGNATTEDAGNEENRVYTWEGGPAAARWVKVLLDAETPGWHALLSEIEVIGGGASDVADWELYE
ncbi:MAG: hypothetical protein ABIH23_19765 [bacterium]